MIRKFLKFLGLSLVVLFGTITILLSRSITWMFDTWAHLSMDELVYQLTSPIEGTSEGVINEYIVWCVPITAIVFLTMVIVLISARKNSKLLRRAVCAVLCLSLSCNVYYIGMAWQRLDIGNYIKNRNTESDFIGENYVYASDVDIVFPEQKRNLIYIFLESMETTYADVANGGGFEENYIKELTMLAQENEDFSGSDNMLNGGTMMPNTTWTIAGMLAHSAGIPLDIPIHGLDMDTQETFFPGISSIGDILNAAGYSQTLFIGSEAAFAGRELYFSEHGNYAMKDYLYAIDMGRITPDYKVWWGYEDKKLFDYAKEELLNIAQQEQPFNFTMLTADTHFEDGYVCEDCGTEYGEDRYANVISCASSKVYEFVNWIKEQDFYENTTIVITGDHLTMDSDFCEEIDGTNGRKVYTTYINSAVSPEQPELRREFSVFDNYPTTLASLGVTIEGNRLGLGTNLFSSRETLSEQYGTGFVMEELKKESEFMNELAEKINLENEELLKREGKLPTANVVAGTYDFTTALLPLNITDIQNLCDDAHSVAVAVWVAEDQSDLQWMPAIVMEDGNYYVDINVASFGYKTGGYKIDVYAIHDDGTQQFIGGTVGYVE